MKAQKGKSEQVIDKNLSINEEINALVENAEKALQTYVTMDQEQIDKIEERKEEIIEAAEIRMKYSGYIIRERELADKMRRLEGIKIKGKFDYPSLQSLSTEARQKLARINPETMAQASRIPGVSPSDINVLLVLMKR